jgi:hypothetical protein
MRQIPEKVQLQWDILAAPGIPGEGYVHIQPSDFSSSTKGWMMRSSSSMYTELRIIGKEMDFIEQNLKHTVSKRKILTVDTH